MSLLGILRVFLPGGSAQRCLRIGCIVFLASLITAVLANDAAAQWPDYPSTEPHSITRGTGHYFSWIKLGICGSSSCCG